MNKPQIEFLKQRIDSILSAHQKTVDKKFPLRAGMTAREKTRLIMSGRARVKRFTTQEDDFETYVRIVDLFDYPGDAALERFNQKQLALRAKAMAEVRDKGRRLLDAAVLLGGVNTAKELNALASLKVV